MTLIKIPLKLIAIPFIIALTVLVAFMMFLFQLSEWLFILALSILGLGRGALLITGDTYGGIGILVKAFLISPYGLPAIAEWFTGLLDNLNSSLKCFVVS